MDNLPTELPGDGNKLTAEQQIWVVTQLACCESPAEVRKALRAQGVEITPQSLSHYDPTTAAGRFSSRKAPIERDACSM